MNYLKYSFIIMILLFVCLVFVGSSFASSDIECTDLKSDLNTIYQNDSTNTQFNLKSENSLNYPDLDESKKSIKVSSKNISLNGSSEIKSVNSVYLDDSFEVRSVNAISGNTFEDIQNAIDNAKNGDKIILNSITYSGKGSYIYVDKSVSIVGNGATLNAKGSSIIFRVSSPNVNITNIHFINGYSKVLSSAAAIILLEDANHCTISNCVFKNNTAQQGAVYVKSNYNNVLYCNFTDNKGILVEDDIIYKNTAKMSGGLNSNYLSSHIYVLGCIFKGNVGRAGGGASLRGNYDTIINCSFISNSVHEGTYDYSYAGALHVGPNNGSKSSASIFNCTFIGNSVYNNLHKGHGGALCFEDGSIMDNCTFINNYCEGVGGATTLHGSGTISNCRFINCTSSVNGGAISTGYGEIVKVTANFTNCYFEGNAAPVGGAVCSIGEGISFSKSIFIDNMAVTGGAVYVEGNNAFFNNLSVISNSGDMGGAFYIEGNRTKLNNTLLNSNNANSGGAVIIIGSNSNLTNLNLSRNIAKYGGGIYINGSNTLVSNVVFDSNQAIPLKDTPYNDSRMNDGIGGGAFINGVNTKIENSIFTYNSARNGSGVYLSGSKIGFTNVSTEGANKAWSYILPLSISLNPNGTISFNITHYGGNNINGGNQSTNYIYLNTSNKELTMDGLTPVDNVENSNEGIYLFKDCREQYQNINVYLLDNDGEIYDDFSDFTDLYGFLSGEFDISNLEHNVLYKIVVTHEDDTFYSYITNSSYFTISEPLVSKSSDKEIVFKDEIINYNLTIENIAPLAATFLVTDIIPEYFVYQGTNLTPIYEYDYATHKISWNVTIPAKSICIINIWGYSIKTNINLTNFIEVYNPDTNISVNASSTVVVLPEANLNISIIPDKKEINKGENLTWTINVTNNGPDSAYDLVITDLFDSNLMEFIYCNDSRFNPDTRELCLDVLDANDSFSFDINVNILKSNIIIDDLVNVFSPINTSEHIPNNCSANASSLVLPQANLILTINADVYEVNMNDTVCWTVNLTNLGPDTASDVVIFDILDLDNLEFISCNDSRFNAGSNKLDLGDMVSNDTLIFEIYTKVIKSGVNISNFVNAYSPTNNSNFVANNVSDDDSIRSKAIIDIHVNKSSNLEKVTVGDKVIWTITVINKGLNTAHDVYAIDKIPHSLEFIRSYTNVGTYDSISGKWHIGDVECNVKYTLTIVTKAIKSGNVTNQVLVYLSDQDCDDKVIVANYTVEVDDIPMDDVKMGNKISLNIVAMENTGNPLLVLLISLTILSLQSLRRKF